MIPVTKRSNISYLDPLFNKIRGVYELSLLRLPSSSSSSSISPQRSMTLALCSILLASSILSFLFLAATSDLWVP